MGIFCRHHNGNRPVFMKCNLACYQIVRALLVILLTSTPPGNNAQKARTFPPLFNAALERPVLTNPTSSTCGGPAMQAYCMSSTNVESINRCVQDYCLNTCPGRSALPGASSMLLALPGADGCVEADTINVRPGASPGNFSTVFKRQGTNCYLAPTASPRLDASGAVSFTVSSWVWLDSQLPGTLLEKQSTNGDVLFTLQVSISGVLLAYSLFSSDILIARFDVVIGYQQWTHVALQVHDVSASIFINGVGPNLSATTTIKLVSPVSDTNGTYRVGQNKNGTSQFVGRIQDLNIYTVALSNREISQLYTGVFPAVRIQSECRCPSTYPREKPGQTQNCIKNGVIPDTTDVTLRISRNAHPLEYINDGDSNSIWISISQNNVEIDVDLGDQFQVFYVVMQFYSPFPKAVTVLRQKDSNSSFQVWQYYADDCSRFGMPNNGAYSAPDSINCLQFGTNGATIPYSLGNITFNLLAPDPVARPGSTDFYNTPELHEFVRATKVRIRFEDHYYTTASDYRHMYYALYEMIVTAWCDCNGHASQCNTTSLPYTCQCLADSFTQGAQCERCLPLYNNKPFKKGDNLQDYPCQPCICYGHADSCVYNSTLDPFPQSPNQGGGGVCVNCKHSTTGQFCETCLKYYFRPSGVSLYDANVCQACDCHPPGLSSTETDCARVDGQCGCKPNVGGRRCDTCKSGFYGLSETDPFGCSTCNCNPIGVDAGAISCNQVTGQCICKQNVRGLRCDECQFGFYGISANNTAGCTACDCNPSGSTSTYCNPSNGQCICKDRVEGMKCDRCKDGFFNFTSDCIPCNCNTLGSESGTVCDKNQGQCVCKKNVKGLGCNQCLEGTFNFGSSVIFGCSECVCVVNGTVNGTGTCNTTSGNCICKANVEGQDCSRCKANTWGLNATDPLGCQPCNCDPTGTVTANLSICDANTGQCSCLSNRQGQRCDTCARGFYINPTGGCLLCPCYAPGTLAGTFCNAVTGQCECKERFGVTGQQCNQCLPTYYAFDTKNGICTPCNCLAAGSQNTTCNAITGQCQCKPYVEGLPCDRCKAGTSLLDANNPFGCSTNPSQQPAPDLINRTSTSFNFTWRKPDSPNGIILNYNIYRNNTLIGNNTADNTSYQDSSLQPFTYYSYMVEVSNGVGTSRSPAVIFQTLAGNPSGDMILTVTDIRARSAMCSWSPPSNLNGPLLKYVILSRKSDSNVTSTEWEGTSLSVMLTTLSPYARYNLIPRACTVGGCTDSSPVQIVTLSAAPEGQQAPNVTAVSSSELFVSWLPPLLPNGIIIFYELWFRGPQGADGAYTPPASRIFNPSGRYDPLALSGGNPLEPPATSFRVTNLLPFTMYEFQVYSENDVSKAASPWVAGRTMEAAPKYLAPPTVTGISSSALSITWTVPRPEDMQGIVERYRLYENNETDLALFPYNPPSVWVKIYDSNSTALAFVRNGLTPYSTHTFYLEACNSQGCVNSTTVAGRTLLAAPEGVQRPQVDGFNTTVMQITWKPPLYPNGPPPNYKVEKTNIALSYPASVIRGTRFTGGGYYSFSPNVIPQSVTFTGIRLRFRLDQGTGLLLFSATSTQEEFLAVQFVNGRPRFMFDTQGRCSAITEVDYDKYPNWVSLVKTGFHTIELRRNGNYGTMLVDEFFKGCTNIAFITTTNDEGLVYNDRKWHTFEARREGVYGEVTVDSKWKGQSNIRDSTCQDTSIIGPTTGVFVGGFPVEFILRRTDNTRRVETTPLQGCIDNVEILTQKYPDEVWTKLDWTQGVTNDLAFLNWQGCPINLEPGFHFMGKGYLMLSHCTDKLVCIATGDRIEIRFRMRTTLHTGLLFLIYGGNGIYMYSVLDNGRLRFSISNNNNNTMVVYDKADSSLCDGKWRLLIFSKIGQQASISIPTEKNVSIGDPNVVMILPLTSEINLGGIKPGSNAMKYVQQNGLLIPGEGFGGCFSGFAINVKEYPTDMTLLDVANTNLDGCPPYHDAETTCQSSLITQIYNGTDTVAYDRGLLPYTDYIYRVVASNSAGEGYSSWAYGRTREGAPSGVKGPVSVRPISGNEVEVVWLEPDITYGLLTKFIIMAYVSNMNNQSVSMDILDVTLTAANMTGVIPDTTYLIKIKACTPGGCTESPDGMQVTMPVEAPENVSAPTADPGPTFLFVKWTLPAKPNGPITGFFLYREGSEIYKGGQLSYNVTGLQVYTAYRFYVSACTTAGCTNGPSVALSTTQLPPTAVGQPKLTVLGTSQIQVTWDPPSQLNGVLLSYMLYSSTTAESRGDVVYNSTSLMPYYVISGLLAGTTYYITLGACTGGGCTLGPPASARTEESAPDGVALPVVMAVSTSELLVTWTPPQFPNGAIVRYNLIQNGVQVYTGLNMSYSSQGLDPYSRHVFRVEACTVRGCASSREVEARTKEAPPVGLIILTASVADARTVNLSWTAPDKLNGLLMYQVYFTGLFYVDPANWNYTTVTDRRLLLNVTVPYTLYTVTTLIPMSSYSIQVNGTNSVGFILSNIVGVTMPPGTPDGVAPPRLVSDTPRSIQVTWQPVGRINANETVAYLLQFMETTENAMVQDEYGSVLTLSYTKMNLLPFTEYKFRIVATNSFGRSQSDWASLITKQDKPASISVPVITGVKARYIDIMWSPPLSANGIISNYNIYMNGAIRSKVAGNVTNQRVDNLVPYTDYMFEVEACTVGGCTKSLPSSTFKTLEDVPEELALPVLKALSPSAIQIVYQTPGKPNGLVTQYIIERKVGSSDNATVVTTRVAEMPFLYIDESNSLTPYSVYSYRVSVQNGAGLAVGPWTQITTGASRPAGVNPPQVTKLNPTSVLVTWQEPVQSNGQIETYVLRFPEPRIEVRNTTQRAVVVTDLTPYKQYSVTLTACTSGGCTESAATPLTTDPSIPAGQGAPVATAISQSRISILWQPPTSPNGPNITYELSRMKVRQPLDNTVTDIGVWQSVYRGPGLFFEDTNLPMFTTYVYRTTVYNIISQTTSPNSTESTTYGGLPRLPPNVTAVARDHLSIVVNWTLPSPVDLQGEVQTLTLQAWSSTNNVTVYPDRGQVSFVVDSLQPDTEYSVTLTVTIFGGAYLASQPILVRTKDGAPSGLNPPQVSIVSTTSLRVSWTAPTQPNGEILAYNILINDRKIPTGSKIPGTAVITNLQPYTVYDIRIESCTVYACTVSKSTLGTTAEALPQGLAAPTVIATTPTQVIVAWRQPDKPNGIIQRYDLWRKTQKSCAELPTPTPNEQLQKCSYVECGILENICGSVCYSGSKVCCNGIIVDSKVGFECCGTNYVYKPRSDYICCSGQFFEPKANFSCCGNRYIEVVPGEICCTDSNEDRVSVSQGDTCCGSMPFSVSGAQFCCQGVLMNKLGRKCCGERVISDSTTCCGTASEGQMYLQQVGFTCCGQEYVEAKLTLCCVNDIGYAKTHYYASEQEKLVASDKCCGANRVTRNLACCNYVGYNQLSQVCADRSRQETGCGTGVVCPLSQLATSYCNRCDFDPSQHVCGSVKGSLTQPTPAPNTTSTCTTATERIYSGLNLTYTDYNLTPYSQYEFNVIAVNSAGTTSSAFTPVLTLEAPPEQVLAPSTRVAPGELFAIYLTWTQPLKPNGILTSYSLKRDGIQLYSGMGTNFTDDLNILPYRSYSYMLTACNNAGCGDSDLITVATAQAMPEYLLPPYVEVINSTQIKVMAQPPGSPNGVILSYSVYIIGSNRVYNSTVPQEFIITDLVPFTSYAIEMKVCTVVGCAVSPNVTVTTSEDLPQGLAAPRIIVISSKIIELYWRAPNVSNGILLGYKVIQTRPAPVTEVYFGNDTNLRLSSLQPGQSYTYQLQVSNRAGVAWSAPREIIMPLVAPLNVPPPQTVRVLSATSIEVKWQPVTSDQGDIDGYTVLLNIGLQTEVARGVGLDTSIIISPLLPYTQYEVRLQACLRNVLNGCGTSSGVMVTTLEDVPFGLAAPKLEAVASNSVQVTWTSPTNPNGIITTYRVFQRKLSANDTEILVNQVAGNVYRFLHSGQDLKPFQVYEYKVLAANSIGQVVSDWSSVRTLESAPTNIAPPVINSVSTYGVSVSWTPPEVPNGIIKEYRIYYQPTPLSSINREVYVSVGGNVTSSALSGLEAFSGYVLSVEAVNGAGSLRSASISFTTREGYPSGLSDFKVEKINTGLSVILSWDVPKKPNGVITGYKIFESASDVPIYSGLAQQFEFRRLMPYTQYSVRLEACTKVGCSSGKVQPFYTAEILPSAQPSPVFGNVNGTNVQMTWKPPVNPNGVITSYQVMRMSSALRRRRSVDTGSMFNSVNSDILTQQFLQFSYETCCDNLITSQLAYYVIDKPEHDFGVFLDHVDLDDVDIIAMPRIKRQTSSTPQVVYQTTDTKQDQYNYTDTGLQPYTSYQYSIRASNSLGSTDSPWQTVTTQQAAPDGVQPPKIAYINNSITSLNITWSPPAQMNGVLQGYQIQRNNNVPFSFPPNFERLFIDTDLLPYTTYSYKLTVCTGGGCTSSEPAAIRTLEASPFLVSPPQLEALNSTALKATWSKPQISNGEITGYRLKMDGSIVYSGLDQVFITGKLAPYESHVFTLTACTNGGCTESGEVSERTQDAPPAGLSPPLLRVLSSNSIEITWSAPANPNGVISTYYLRRGGALIYISNIEASGNIVMTKIDDSLVPGEEYSYTVEAVNRKGSVESGAAKAVTYSSSPTGLAPPTVTPVSATSIQVDWTPPSNPNGQITSYAIYEGTNKVYTGGPSQLSYTVPGLQYYTQYSFRVEACTNRGCQVSQPASAMTREAKPEGQPPPTLLALADEQGAHAGVRVSWENPTRANGNITGYEVQRRSVLNGAVYGDPVKVYSGTERQFTDTSTELKPFSQYQYMVVVANSVDRTESVWASVTTKEGPPQDVLPPIVNTSTAYTITVTIPQPKVTNGVIRLYRILVNNTMLSSSPSEWQIIGLSPPLLPYTAYELKAQACTSGGCGTSAGVIAWTDSAKPMGLAAIKVRAVSNDSATLEWSPPETPNGKILRYEVYMRKSCPPTFQPFNQTCLTGDASTAYSGLNLSTTVSNLDPYTAYSFQLQAFNERGGVDFPTWLTLETKEAMPLYVQFPKLIKNGTLAEVDWSNSFMLNGLLREYILYADGMTVFRGISTVGGVERTNKNQAISFTITLVTNTGRVESPVIVFDPSAVDNIGTTTPAVVLADKSTKTAVYEEVWFIVLMCILALLILFVVLALCVRRSGSKEPYIRERMPLQRQGQGNMPRGLYVIDATDGSVIDASGLSPSHRNNRDHFYQGPGVGIINPAFAEDHAQGRLTLPNPKYIDDDDDLRWGQPYDSGLFDDMDDDSSSGHTYSYTKEQTVFTDTHL